jgi:hypothetical protein
VPEWEVKCAAGLHMWLDAEHSAALRKRITEMREPPLYLDKVPDAAIELFFQELIRSETTLELLVGVYGVAKKELIRSLRKHLAETNPLVDHPTCRLLKLILIEEEEMLAWGEQAVDALTVTEEDRAAADRWREHLELCLQAAGGFPGDLEKPVNRASVTLRTEAGKPYEMKAEPRRDARFVDKYNGAGKIDDYYLDEARPPDERTYALLYKRLKEMTVPEWMGPIIYKTEGKPWDYYVDMSRQLWDEARHSMLGEVGLYQDGIEFYKYPIDFRTSLTLNTKFDPLEAHVILWYFEQRQMPKQTGKRLEWIIAKMSDNELAQTFQDYDWADEVLHTQFGRKWLVSEVGGLEELKKKAEELLPKIVEERAKLDDRSEQTQGWTQFIADIRESRSRLRAGQLENR